MHQLSQRLDQILDNSNVLTEKENNIEIPTKEANKIDIMQFLNEEETKKSQMCANNDSPSKFKCQISAIQLELDEAYNTIEALKATLDEERKRNDSSDSTLQSKLKEQESCFKAQLESEVSQRINTMDEILSEKEALINKYKELKSQKDEQEKKYEKKIKLMQDNKAIDAKKTKEVMAIKEKGFREKWIQAKTQEIKENTLKGIEPEIQKIVAKHKQETNAMQAKHQQEINYAKTQLSEQINQKEESLKITLSEELQKQFQTLTEQYSDKYNSAISQHKSEINQINQKSRESIEEIKRALGNRRDQEEMEHAQHINQIKTEYEQRITAANNEHEIRLKSCIDAQDAKYHELKKSIDDKAQEMYKQYKVKEKSKMKQKIVEINEQMTAQRNIEIQAIIHKLGEETQKSKKLIIIDYEQKINSINEKYNHELVECREANQTLTNKLETLQIHTTQNTTQLQQYEKRIDELTQQLIQKEANANQINKPIMDENIIQRIVQEKTTQIKLEAQASLENALQKQREYIQQMSKQEAQHNASLQELNYKHKIELDELKEYQTNTNLEKEKQICQIMQQIQIKDTQLHKCKELIDKQRRELLCKK